jgi:hypothetical protein
LASASIASASSIETLKLNMRGSFSSNGKPLVLAW